MKRITYHIIFWVVYFAYDAFLQISYMHPYLAGIPAGRQIVMGIGSSLTVLPLKLGVTYFALYVLLDAVLVDNRRVVFRAGLMIIITGVSVVLYRVAHSYFINPYIYGGRENRPELFGFLYLWEAAFEISSVAGLAIVVKLVRMQFQIREKERRLDKEKLETELKFLRNQTNPHFLFNTLNNIYALALKGSDETPGVVLQLSQLLHFMLFESGEKTIPIRDEVKILEDYIALQKIRYSTRLEVFFSRKIDDQEAAIAQLLLLSFVENAFKHGAGESRFKSYIAIDLKLREGVLHFSIENTREWSAKPAGNGKIGLTNARRQLELLYSDHHLQVADEKEFFKVHLMINLKSLAKI